MPEAAEPRVSPEQRLASLFESSARESTEAPEPEARREEPAPERDEPEREDRVAEPERDAADAPKQEADDAIQVSNLGELAEALGIEVAELYNLRVPVTSADGTRDEVSIGEWKDAYQSSKKLHQLQADIESRRAAIEQQAAQSTEQMQQRLNQIDALMNAAERQLLADFESVNWNELRQADPSEWAARRQDFVERQKAINDAKTSAVTEATRLQREQAEKLASTRGEVLQREAAAVVAAIPEWADETKAKAEKAQLFDYLVSAGFDAKNVGEIADHRIVVMARKAMLHDQRTVQGKEAVKKLVKVTPKMLKPGAASSKAEQSAEASRSIRERLKKSGRVEDFAALIKRR